MQKLPFKVIDLTHSLSPDIPTWTGDCGFRQQCVMDHVSEAQYSFRAHQVNMHEGIGTHLDAPLHINPDAKDVASLELYDLIAPAIVIDVSAKANAQYRMGIEDIHAFENQHGAIAPGSFVIIFTGWSKYWTTPNQYRNDLKFPSIDNATAELLVHKRHIVGLGIDTLSPDCPIHNEFPVHNTVLGANKYIVENIANAHLLPPVGSYIFALPIKIQGGAEAPMRLIGLQLTDR